MTTCHSCAVLLTYIGTNNRNCSVALVPAAMDGAAVDGEDGEEKEPFSETLMTQVLRRAKWDDLATRVRGDLDGKIFTLITEIVHRYFLFESEYSIPWTDKLIPF